ncbi:SUN domain-containing protein 4-like [Silene latifolia]|uniref:SUN domain-containing protein 4-like n=1 Tax=Silene latifolia TaxID=37657 RepID=UPI003D788E11
MQRSRRALLQHGSFEKADVNNRLYKLSLSLVIVLWGLAFLWNLWISHGDVNSDRVKPKAFIVLNISSWDERRPENNATLDSAGKAVFPTFDSCNNETITAVKNVNLDEEAGKDNGKTDSRLTRTVPLDLDEFKSRAFSSRSSTCVSTATGGAIHRMELVGGKYNHASAGKGAKVLDFNKEAKGASDILNKDKDKYLRNPCSVEEKFVVIELSEETLVDTVEIANFEHYSSNLREFELLGSLVYPTQTWVQLGSFSAENVKHAQIFTLSDPKWVRYLKLKLLTHFGSEFYCTLSSIEVYGVDAVEKMLEDLVEQQVNRMPDENAFNESDLATETVPEAVDEVRHQQVNRMPGDTVLKILMQKVRALDMSLNALEGYLENVNVRYESIFKEFDTELEEKDLVLEKIRSELKNVLDSKDLIAKDVEDLFAWRSLVAKQLDGLVQDNAMLRTDIRKVLENQVYMESKAILAFLISIIFGFFALVMLSKNMIGSVCRSKSPRNFCKVKSSWFFLVVSCSTTMVILSL